MYMMSGNQDQENLMRFLTILDPFNHGNITFSQCVTIFSSVNNIIYNFAHN